MKLTAAALLALCASFPEAIALIKERAEAGDNEEQVCGAIAADVAAKAKVKADADAKASADRVIALEAQAKTDEQNIATLKADLAAMTAKHDALAALKAGTVAAAKVKGDGNDPVKPTFNRTDAAAGRIPADVLASGDYALDA